MPWEDLKKICLSRVHHKPERKPLIKEREVELMDKQEWYASLFDRLGEYWAEIAEARSTEKEVEFIENAVRPKGLVLDLCCGTSRHSILLRAKGRKVIGLDLSPNLLRIAKRKMVLEGVSFPLIRAEMRFLPLKEEILAVVINMFTSFGYLPTEKEDMKSLREVARTLKRGGAFLIDVVNPEHLIQVFQKKDWAEFAHFYLLERRTLDPKRMRLFSQWIVLDKAGNKARTFDHNLRLYSLPQLREMLKKAGLAVKKTYGDYEEQRFRSVSPRLIVLAEKK